MSFTPKARRRVSISFKHDSGMTEQHHKESTDIHNILNKYQKTGIIEHTAKYQGQYGTMPTGDQFHEHMNIIAEAESMFESIPSKIRSRFDNDPAKFLDFISNDKNKSELDVLGLDSSHLKAPSEPKPEAQNATPEVSSPV